MHFVLVISAHFFPCYIYRFVDVLDQLDNRVEKLRKEALSLSEKRDVLLMSMDILKNNELLNGLDECKLRKTFIAFCGHFIVSSFF